MLHTAVGTDQLPVVIINGFSYTAWKKSKSKINVTLV